MVNGSFHETEVAGTSVSGLIPGPILRGGQDTPDVLENPWFRHTDGRPALGVERAIQATGASHCVITFLSSLSSSDGGVRVWGSARPRGTQGQ